MGLAGVSLGRDRVASLELRPTRAGTEHARHAVAWLEGRVRLFNRSFGSTMRAPNHKRRKPLFLPRAQALSSAECSPSKTSGNAAAVERVCAAPVRRCTKHQRLHAVTPPLLFVARAKMAT